MNSLCKSLQQRTSIEVVYQTCRHWCGVLVLMAGLATSQAQVPVNDGLALWLKADTGVATNASGQVTAWLDQSSYQNNAAARIGAAEDEFPRWEGGALNGKPVVLFDGINNVLEIPNSYSLQPQSDNWTCFFVAKRLSASKGDCPQIIGSRSWTAVYDTGWSIAYDGNGYLGSHFADGASGHDLNVIMSASVLSQKDFQMWQIEEDRISGTTTFYKNGDLDAMRSASMPASVVNQADSIYIGRDVAGADSRRANMELAEVLIYNRVLPKTEREAVAVYLSDKYGFGFVPNDPPVVGLNVQTNGGGTVVPTTVTLVANASDTDGGVKKVDFFANNNLIATAGNPPYSVPVSVASTGSVAFTAVATDNRSYAVTSAPVTVIFTGSYSTPTLATKAGLQLWLKADSGVTADETGVVSDWADASGNGNNAVQFNTGSGYEPLLVNSPENGMPSVRFDGVDDYLQIPASLSLQPGTGDWTVLFVAKRGLSSGGDYPQIIGSRPWAANKDLGWAVCFSKNSGLLGSHYADGVDGHDVPDSLSSSPFDTGVFQVWQLEENRAQSSTSWYLQGKTNRTLKTTMPTVEINQANDIYVGSEVEGSDNRRANLDLSEMLVYNRILTPAEREEATTYLLHKYSVTQIYSANTAPAVTLSVPGSEGSITAPATITLNAEASDSDGKVVRVDFYNGTASLGTATNSPYGIKTVITALGSLTLTAVATDNLGLTATSAPVVIKVIAPDTQLMGKVDYSDSFTTNTTRWDGLYNITTNGAYNAEDSHGNAAAAWTPTSKFSFNVPASSTDPTKLAAAQGNAGSSTGFAQTDGGDFSIPYGLRSNYVVQVDAIMPSDRLDISSLPSAGSSIFVGNSLSIFLRRDSVANQPGIGLYNGVAETGVTNANGSFVRVGVDDNNWHSFAVNFDQPNSLLHLYVDGVKITTVPLATFANGIYQNYSNGAVGVGGSGGIFWLDNFKVGATPQLIETLDYSDTFSINEKRPDGLYNDNSGSGYDLEDSHGNPTATWTPLNNFSFNTPATSTDVNKLNAATGNIGSLGGLGQTGGGNDFSFAYGLRSNYVVQVDAILPLDRLDISSLPVAGGGLFATNSLTVFFRRDSYAGTPHPDFPETGLPAMGLYNGSKETAVVDASGGLIFTGINDSNWHNIAVQFDQVNNLLKIYVDRILKGTVNMETFGGGIYKNYSNGAVGMGGNGGIYWFDNFQVGAPPVTTLPLSAITLTRQQNNVTLTWTGGGVLEEAAASVGPWNGITGAASPYTTPVEAGQKFYRLRR
jgi:hypothetical protein